MIKFSFLSFYFFGYGRYLSSGNLRDSNQLMDELKKQVEEKQLDLPQSDLLQFIIFLLQTWVIYWFRFLQVNYNVIVAKRIEKIYLGAPCFFRSSDQERSVYNSFNSSLFWSLSFDFILLSRLVTLLREPFISSLSHVNIIWVVLEMSQHGIKLQVSFLTQVAERCIASF